MNTERENFEARLRACEERLEAYRGQLKGMDYALRLVMAVSTDPHRLGQAWHLLLPSIVDTHCSKESYAFTVGLQQTLEDISRQLDEARDRSRDR